jgi:peptidoglycan/xylan/chitin deacetylase (PgdA/CDA1 family)
MFVSNPRRWSMFAVLLVLFVTCGALPPRACAAPDAEPVRFLITFDDGPSLWHDSPTIRILDQLKDNPVVPGIKAVFFVQTAAPSHGGSDEGRALMRQECELGHILALHSGLAAGHIAHTKLNADELADSLEQGRNEILAQCPRDPTLVRPPDWLYNDATLAAYSAGGMHMLLSDMSANDGKIYGWNISLTRRSHFHMELGTVLRALQAGQLPSQDGVHPVMVAFHDVNTFTADHMTEYLNILVEEAKAVGVPLANPPFYTDTDALLRAARKRASRLLYTCDGVSRSASFMQVLFGTDEQRYRGCIP